jgi:hypothetical protein
LALGRGRSLSTGKESSNAEALSLSLNGFSLPLIVSIRESNKLNQFLNRFVKINPKLDFEVKVEKK